VVRLYIAVGRQVLHITKRLFQGKTWELVDAWAWPLATVGMGGGSAGPETVQHAWDIMHQDYGVRRREGGRQGTGQRTTKDKEQDGKKLKLV